MKIDLDPRMSTGTIGAYGAKYAFNNMKPVEDGMFRARSVMAFVTSAGAGAYNCVAFTLSFIANHQFGWKSWKSAEHDYEKRSEKNWTDMKGYSEAIVDPMNGLVKLGFAKPGKISDKVIIGVEKAADKAEAKFEKAAEKASSFLNKFAFWK